MTAQWGDDVHHALHAALTGERQGYYGDFGDAAGAGDDPEPGVLARRAPSRPSGPRSGARRSTAPGTGGHRFLGYLQNHDQVGNRAVGRPARRSAVAPAGWRPGPALSSSPYTPMLFMGEEWGATTPFQFFTDFPDPDLAEAVRKGRRSEFADHGWAPRTSPTRRTRPPGTPRCWTGTSRRRPARRMLAWYRT